MQMGVLCPRCGKMASCIRKKKVYGRFYLYSVHPYYENGKRKFKYCYLGPADGYKYHVSPPDDLKYLTLNYIVPKNEERKNNNSKPKLSEQDRERLIKCYLWHKKYRRRRIQKIFEEVIFPLVGIDPESLSS